MDGGGSSSVSVSDESSESAAAAGCRSASTRSLVDGAAGNLSRTVSDVSTSFSEQCSSVDHSGAFEPVAKLIGRAPANSAAALSRLSMKPRADVLDRRSTDDGTYCRSLLT